MPRANHVRIVARAMQNAVSVPSAVDAMANEVAVKAVNPAPKVHHRKPMDGLKRVSLVVSLVVKVVGTVAVKIAVRAVANAGQTAMVAKVNPCSPVHRLTGQIPRQTMPRR